jgi:hypothetical protein
MTIVCCDGYHVIGSTNDRAEALRIAQNHVDGTYICIIQQDGREIGNSVDGYTDDQPGEYYRDAATQTGMYDAW